jgi:hypothetical protein
MTWEKIKKDWHFYTAIISLFVAGVSAYNNISYHFQSIDYQLQEMKSDLASSKVKNETAVENLKLQQIEADKDKVEIKTKLTNIEATLVDIKQSLKK